MCVSLSLVQKTYSVTVQEKQTSQKSNQGKKSIKHSSISPGKYVPKWEICIKFTADVGNSQTYLQINKSEQIYPTIWLITCNDTRNPYWNRKKKP